MLELLHLDLHKLSNDETITFSAEVCSTIDLFPTLAATIGRVYNPYKSVVTMAVGSTSKVDTSHLTGMRQTKNDLRASGYLFFRGIIESAKQSTDEVEQQAATLLIACIKKHEWRMQALAPDKFSSKLNGLINALAEPSLKAALVTVGADKALAKLVVANQQFEIADQQCIDAKVEHNELSPTKAVKLVGDEFSKLKTAIDALILTSDDPQVVDMVTRLNVITEVKIQTIKAKATRIENAKKEAAENGGQKPVVKRAMKKKSKKDEEAEPLEQPLDKPDITEGTIE